MKILRNSFEFEWNQGNKSKNWARHKVADEECEEVFFDTYKKILKDRLHSGKEARHILIGQTKKQRVLFLVFTIRSHGIRVISARDLNKKEKHLYENKT